MTWGARPFAGGTWADGPEAASGAAEYTIAGAVFYPLTVAATMLEGIVLAGAVTLPLAVAASAMEYTPASGAYTINGAVTLPLAPAATMLEGRVLAGAVAFALSPAAGMNYTPLSVPEPVQILRYGPEQHHVEQHAPKRKKKRPAPVVVEPQPDGGITAILAPEALAESDMNDVADLLDFLRNHRHAIAA